jgi:hypothetical protein
MKLKIGRVNTMIEPEYYQFPHEEPKQQPPKADPETLAYLEALPWRPHGIEW